MRLRVRVRVRVRCGVAHVSLCCPEDMSFDVLTSAFGDKSPLAGWAKDDSSDRALLRSVLLVKGMALAESVWQNDNKHVRHQLRDHPTKQSLRISKCAGRTEPSQKNRLDNFSHQPPPTLCADRPMVSHHRHRRTSHSRCRDLAGPCVGGG